MRKMMTMKATALVAVLTVSGCADTGMSDTQRRTAIGTGVGAVAGAVIASATGGKAGVGAVAAQPLAALAPISGRPIWKSASAKCRRPPKAQALA